MTTAVLLTTAPRRRIHEYLRLCKPKVVSLVVFTAMIGMALATPGLPEASRFIVASLGIAMAASGAAAFNCLVEQRIDALMVRTRSRPLPRGRVTTAEALLLASSLAALGLFLLYRYVNPLTAWLTSATFIGYALVYTVLLKPATPQNIVIGGASGAMPPLLGWVAMTGQVDHEALLLFLIIYAWTPPHFWSLALYRTEDYARAGLPMLPVTHGERYTRQHIFFYTLLLAAVTALPLATGMSGALYGLAALGLNAVFLVYAWRLYRTSDLALARRAFGWSIRYLGLLFAALLADHWLALASSA
jgi:protoheme IX farnesyltransferase